MKLLHDGLRQRHYWLEGYSFNPASFNSHGSESMELRKMIESKKTRISTNLRHIRSSIGT